MSIKNMHYDFKKKFNKIDSQQNRNLRVPEIDWTLNEAMRLFVKMIAQPRVRNHLGFEVNQRTIDDIRVLVVEPDMFYENGGLSTAFDPAVLDVSKNMCTLPKNYWMYLKGYVDMQKEDCLATARLHVKKHEQEFEESPFDDSSFEWREVNALFFKDRLKLFTDGTFTNTKVKLSYIRHPLYMHNAEDYSSKGYNLPSGQNLKGKIDCELPIETHSEIVDIAVMLASSETQSTNFQNTLHKLRLNHLQ